MIAVPPGPTSMLIIPLNVDSFNITIFPPYIGGQCCHLYYLRIFVNGTELPIRRLLPSNIGSTDTFSSVEYFDLCAGSYSFTANALGALILGYESIIYYPEPVEFISKWQITDLYMRVHNTIMYHYYSGLF